MWDTEKIESLVKRAYKWLLVKGLVGSVVFVLSIVVAVLIPDFLLQKLFVFGLGWLGGLAASYILRSGH